MPVTFRCYQLKWSEDARKRCINLMSPKYSVIVTENKGFSSRNRPFLSSKKSHFQSEAKCETIVMKMIFNYDANKTHFHNKGFALSLVLKVIFFGTRKWPIANRTPGVSTATFERRNPGPPGEGPVHGLSKEVFKGNTSPSNPSPP